VQLTDGPVPLVGDPDAGTIKKQADGVMPHLKFLNDLGTLVSFLCGGGVR